MRTGPKNFGYCTAFGKFVKVVGMTEGERRRLLASSARPTRTLDIGGSAWSALVLAKRAAGINRIVRMAVLVHARTFGLIQPAPYEKEQA